MFNENKNIIAAFGFILIMALAPITSTLAVGTPDGATPANEGVCDVLQGGTPGLYGLCVAYCEAQDSDMLDVTPNTKILDNYNRKKQEGDPAMPCVQEPCPCWNEAELASFVDDGVVGGCLVDDLHGIAQVIDNTQKYKLADADIREGRERCRYIDLNNDPITLRPFTISPAEAQGCYTAIANLCGSM